MEIECKKTREKTDAYYKYNKMYTTYDPDISNQIHEYNIKKDDSKEDSMTIPTMIPMLVLTLTKHKMTQELLTYELLNYRTLTRTPFDKSSPSFNDVISQIKFDLERFNPIIQSYLEDRVWTLNTSDTVHFAVPKNKIIFSNTISMQDQENHTVITHMDMLIGYIKRCYKVATLKYVIVEDNKYDVVWILLSIGYHDNENKVDEKEIKN
jgi:hypothetical protein